MLACALLGEDEVPDNPKHPIEPEAARPESPDFWRRVLWVGRVDGIWIGEAIEALRAAGILKDASDAAWERFTETNEQGDWREQGSRSASKAAFMLFAQAIELGLKEILVRKNADAPLSEKFNRHTLVEFSQQVGLDLTERQRQVLGYCERALGPARYPIPRITKRPEAPPAAQPDVVIGDQRFPGPTMVRDFAACEEIFSLILSAIQAARAKGT
jgi:hypothetical protein